MLNFGKTSKTEVYDEYFSNSGACHADNNFAAAPSCTNRPGYPNSRLFIWVCAAPKFSYLVSALSETFTAYRTYDLIFALYFVMCLEIELRTGGILDDLVLSLHRLLKSPRLTLAIMPAFLGLLPSLGGARFSAPIVEMTAKGLGLAAEHKANINFWFRHIFEFSSPIIPGMLMACSIANIPFSQLLLHLAWVTPLFFAIGWLVLMRKIKILPLQDKKAPASMSCRSFVILLLPLHRWRQTLF